MYKSVAQHQLKNELKSQESISSPLDTPRRRGSIRDGILKFKFLRTMINQPQEPPKKPINKKISKILEKNPRCSKYYNKFKDFQKLVYILMNDTTSSMLAKALFVIITIAVLFTTVIAIVTSAIGTTKALEWIEFAISLLFLIEYTFRLLSASAFDDSFLKSLVSPSMIIDLLGLLPFFLQLGFGVAGFSPDTDNKYFKILRWTKTLRLLKLSRYLRDTQVFYEGMRASIESFGFLTLLIALVDIVGATAIYYAETELLPLDFIAHEDQHITSMADSMWYVLVTLATVGYGDFTPQTILGKIIASILAVIGMLIFSLPIAILGNNFQKTYNQQTENERVQRHKAVKFEANKNYTDSQKEVMFMNERIETIDFTNKSIISMLSGSEVLYKQVAKDLKNLYEWMYYDEEHLAKKLMKKQQVNNKENKASPFLGSKLDNRIKLYEKLNRAKKKINLANILQRGGPTQFSGGESIPNLDSKDNNIKDVVEEDIELKPVIRPNKPKKTVVPDGGLRARKTKLPSDKMDLDQSDLIETDVGPPPNNVPSMEKDIKSKMKRGFVEPESSDDTPDRISIISHRPSRPNKKQRAFMKSHSVNNPNSFLSYYVQNLHFIPLELLDELIDNKESECSDSDTDSDSSDSLLDKKNVNRGRRASVSDRKIKFNLTAQKPEQGARKDKKRKTRIIDTTKKGKMMPKNYDTKLWELTGKILERMDEKIKLENSLSMLEKSVDNRQDYGEIDRAIAAAAQAEIKRLVDLKKERNQFLSNSNSFDLDASIHHHHNGHGDGSVLLNLSYDERSPGIEAHRHAHEHMKNLNIPIIKEEDEMSVVYSGNATPLTKFEYPKTAQKTLGNLKNSRWKLAGRTGKTEEASPQRKNQPKKTVM